MRLKKGLSDFVGVLKMSARYVFKFIPLEPNNQVSPRYVVSRLFRPRPYKPTSWFVKYDLGDPEISN